MIEAKKKFFSTLFTIPEGERGILILDGQIETILKSGRHSVPSFRKVARMESHALSSRVFSSVYAEALQSSHLALVAEHFVTVQTAPGEVAVLTRDGQFFSLQKPDSKVLYWKDAGPWTTETIDTLKDVSVPVKLAGRINTPAASALVRRHNIEEGQVGLLYVDGALVKTLAAGLHVFWNVSQNVNVRIIDTREHALDVAGQEILTRDKVSIRVNLAAKYRVADPEKAVTSVKDYVDALYRALQHAFRQSLATKTLDELLTRKGEVDGEAARSIRAEMEKIGLTVGDIAIKDVVLPGEVRDILNRVVTAEKEAEANIIRRREETNATRSLLNTAKVMAENPMMLRLKELEALEKIADKVQTLNVNNGTRGLLDDLVSLKSPTPPKRK